MGILDMLLGQQGQGQQALMPGQTLADQTQQVPLQRQGGLMGAIKGGANKFGELPMDERLMLLGNFVGAMNQSTPPGIEKNTMARLSEGITGGIGPLHQLRSFKERTAASKEAREDKRLTLEQNRKSATNLYQQVQKQVTSRSSEGGEAITPKESILLAQAEHGMLNPESFGESQYKSVLSEMPGEESFGTGMEAQVLDRYLQNKDDPEWLASAEGQLVQQRLSRGQATPMGMIPGYDLSGMGEGQPSRGTIPKPLTEGESRDRYAATSMVTAEQSVNDVMSSNGFDPTDPVNKLADVPFFGNMLTTGENQQYRAGADEFATNLVFLRSGATARQEEKDTSFVNFWPQPWDKPGTVIYKKMIRKQQMLNAFQKGQREGRVASPDAQETLGLLQRQSEAARIEFDAFRQSSPGYKAPPQVGDVRDGYMYRGGDPGNPNSWVKQDG